MNNTQSQSDKSRCFAEVTEIGRPLTSLSRKRKKAGGVSLGDENGVLRIDSSECRPSGGDFFESLNSPKLKNLEEIAEFLDAYDLSK